MTGRVKAWGVSVGHGESSSTLLITSTAASRLSDDIPSMPGEDRARMIGVGDWPRGLSGPTGVLGILTLGATLEKSGRR